MKKQQQVKLKIPKKVLETLQDLADQRGQTLEETLRHSIATESYFNSQLEKGNKILIQDSQGEIWKVVFSHLK